MPGGDQPTSEAVVSVDTGDGRLTLTGSALDGAVLDGAVLIRVVMAGVRVVA
jgi:hypothetical protein